MNEVAAVKNHGRRHGHEQRAKDRRHPPQAIPDRKQQQNKQRPKDDRYNPEDRFLQLDKTPDATKPSRDECQIVERRAVVLVRIILVASSLHRFAELDRVDRLVAVHGTLRQIRQTKHRRRCCDEQDEQDENGATHWID